MTDMYYLIYTSIPARRMDDQALQELLTVARQANRQFDVTGMLVFFPDSFIQLIEGPKAHIEQLYQNIQRDQRHLRVTTLREGPIQQRYFPDWSMAYEKRNEKFGDTAALDLQDEKVRQLFSIMEN